MKFNNPQEQKSYVLITVSGGVAEIAQNPNNVDVDIFDWDDMKEKIASGFSEILSDGELENLKKNDPELYGTYISNCEQREQEERGIAAMIRSRADVIEQLLLADEAKVITELQNRGWEISQTLSGTLGNAAIGDKLHEFKIIIHQHARTREEAVKGAYAMLGAGGDPDTIEDLGEVRL